MSADLQDLIRQAMARVSGREPSYRYYQTDDGAMFIWTTERMGDGKFASAIFRPYGPGSRSGKRNVTRWRTQREVHHRTRRAAKARAYSLYRDHRLTLVRRRAMKEAQP